MHPLSRKLPLTPNSTFLQCVKQDYGCFAKWEDKFRISFKEESSGISLDIPEDGQVTSKGWRILPHYNPTVSTTEHSTWHSKHYTSSLISTLCLVLHINGVATYTFITRSPRRMLITSNLASVFLSVSSLWCGIWRTRNLCVFYTKSYLKEPVNHATISTLTWTQHSTIVCPPLICKITYSR